MNPMDFPQEQLRYSHEAEGSLIGALLMHGPQAYDAVSGLVSKDSFFDALHQSLWGEAEKLVLAGKHVDVLALMDAMRGADVDWAYVNQLTHGYSSQRTWARDAEIIAGYARQRQLELVTDRAAKMARDESISLEQRVSRAVMDLEQVLEQRNAAVEAVPVSTFSVDLLSRLMDLADGKVQPGRLTHIPTLDAKLAGGFRDGQLVIIAARPSVGKSSLAQQIALTHAQDGIPSAFFGMEMSNIELTNRTVANIGRVGIGGLKTGRLEDHEWSRVTEAVERLSSLPLLLLDQPSMTLGDVSSQARKLVRKHKVKTLVVDYLQLMRGPSGKDRDRRVELEEITRGMKQLAKQLGITIFLLSQLNRSVEQRTNPRPVMSDLKECGAIEEDADVILALWTARKGDGSDLKGCAILKNRDGETGDVALHFEGPYQRWTESTESLRTATAPARKGGYTEEF